MKADKYRETFKLHNKQHLKLFEDYLRVLYEVDPGVRMKRTRLGTYLIFSDGSVLLLGRAEVIELTKAK